MTVEEVMKAIRFTEVNISDNIAAWVFAAVGALLFIFYLVMFIKDDLRLPRPFCLLCMLGSLLWVSIGVSMGVIFPKNVSMKAEFDPNVVSEEQLDEYFNTYSLKWWGDGKMVGTLYPKANVYKDVLEVLENEEGEEIADEV